MTADRRSPLGLEARETMRELPFLTQFGLRTRTEEGRAVAGRALGCPLPVEPNTTARIGDRTVLWLGPHEWLVVDPPDGEAALEADLATTMSAGLGAVVDLSANRTTLELRGADARDLLARGCALDLHPRAFGPGRCAQTMVGRAGVILELSDAAPTFRLFVRGSFASYLAGWLLDGMEELAASARASVSRRQRSVRPTSLNV